MPFSLIFLVSSLVSTPEEEIKTSFEETVVDTFIIHWSGKHIYKKKLMFVKLNVRIKGLISVRA